MDRVLAMNEEHDHQQRTPEIRLRSMMSSHESSVRRQCRSELFEKHLAEDVTNETFLAAFAWLKSGREIADESERSWLGTTGHRLCIRYNDRSARSRERVTLDEGMVADDTGKNFNEESKEAFWVVVSKLSNTSREVLELYLEGYSGNESASRLGISHASYRTRLKGQSVIFAMNGGSTLVKTAICDET